MSNVNSVTISGNLTRDPEYKTYGDDGRLAKFGVAVNRSVKRNDEYTEEVSFFDVTVFGGFAELTKKKLHKGDSATVQGELRQERWTVGEGDEQQNRSAVVIIASQIDSEGFFRPADQNAELTEGETAATTEAPAAAAAVTETPAPADDDIPF